MTTVPAAFYCVADARYFLGAVGLINSLRLQGHDEPIFLLDVGLEEWQREQLAGGVEIVPAPADVPPWLAKTHAPLAHPAETMVLIDVDMVVTRPLGELIERAARGAVIAFENDADRFVSEWSEALGLGPLERRPYVCSGLVFCGGREGLRVLRLLDELQRRVDIDRTYFGRNEPGYPFTYPEQDVLNAILASDAIPGERVEILPFELAPMPPFDGVRVLDEDVPRCADRDGTSPFVLHHFFRKPWLERMYHGPYSRFLARCLTGPGLAIEVPTREVPLRFRRGGLAALERVRAGVPDVIGWKLRGIMPRSAVARLDARRRRRVIAR